MVGKGDWGTDWGWAAMTKDKLGIDEGYVDGDTLGFLTG